MPLGDHDFSAILSEHGPALGRVAASYEANPALQQELLQEISLAVWQALQSFKHNSSVKTYIMRVAHNRAVNHVAKQARQTDRYALHDNGDLASTCNEQQQQDQQRLALLLNAIRQLPLQPRQIVTLSMEGFSYHEISEVVGIAANNVGVILNRTRKSLREILDD